MGTVAPFIRRAAQNNKAPGKRLSGGGATPCVVDIYMYPASIFPAGADENQINFIKYTIPAVKMQI